MIFNAVSAERSWQWARCFAEASRALSLVCLLAVLQGCHQETGPPINSDAPVLGAVQSIPCEGEDHRFIKSRCGRFYPDKESPVYISFAVLAPQHDGLSEPLSPIVYFSGGPGEGGNTQQGKLDHWRYWLLDNDIKRPMILWDSRGNDGAWGYFECEAYRLWSLNRLRYPAFADDDEDTRIAACLQQWQSMLGDSGFAQFSARQNAKDVLALLRHLGYSHWHLMSTSYGSRVALWLASLAPESGQSAIFDSPYSWTMDDRVSHAAVWAQSFSDALAWCQQRESCHRGDTVDALFWRAIETLDAEPAAVRFRLEGYHQTASIDADTFAHLLFATFYAAHGLLDVEPSAPRLEPSAPRLEPSAPRLEPSVKQLGPSAKLSEPSAEQVSSGAAPIMAGRLDYLVPLLRQIIEGDTQLLQRLVAPVLARSYSSFANPWLYWAAECNDNKVLSAEDYTQGVATLGAWSRFLAVDMSLKICHMQQFAKQSLAPEATDANRAIPSVLLAGEFDPVVSRRDVIALAQSLKPAVMVQKAGVGHGVIAGGHCGDWLPAFWRSPHAFVSQWHKGVTNQASGSAVGFPEEQSSACYVVSTER
ncbi:MAG TPA: alpha/beta hydrolase [Marinagarivorans sp.]